MLKPALAILLGCALPVLSWAQGDLGWDVLPDPATPIDELPYVGESNDFSGGVAVGDVCPDFTMYDLNGVPITLSEELRPDKYTVLVSMSQSCIRVIQGFDPTISPNTMSFMSQYGDDFNWIPIYVEEAHPADVENCPSNCPGTVILSLDGDSIWSHQTYQDRHDLASEMLFFGSNPGYSFDYPFDNIYLDNPDNGAFVDIFQAPFGIVVLDCAGEVVLTEPFLNQYLNNQENWNYLVSLSDQADSDGDMICNEQEVHIGTDPFDPCDPNGGDSDDDGVCDNLEMLNGTDPYDPCDPFIDVDDDDICDFIDEDIYIPPCVTDPTDSDGDGICDGQELEDGTDPTNPCDPNGIDTDGDGLCDLWEELNGSEPLDPCDPDGTDTDGDGYCDFMELALDTDPEDPCNPDFIDSDGDGYCNLEEINNGWNPGDVCDPDGTDTDEDGLCDLEEAQDGTDPEDPCDPDNTDTDGDGTCDLQELLDGTDPLVDENAVGVEEYAELRVTAYPNPVGETLTLRTQLTVAFVDVMDINGKLIQRVRAQSVLDSSPWAAGVYTLRVQFTDGRSSVLRVVK